MKRSMLLNPALLGIVLVFSCVFLFVQTSKAAWPTKPVEYTIFAGAGSGADEYTRFLIDLNVKDENLKQGRDWLRQHD